ncbi:carboxypeptidase domain-containing protein [Desulfonema limicola]|uniref:Carboxypeptidase domain-containing protein n=1 Tax=Desulfonema limicola TaxID=45656 RepID=A0A975B3Q5_9BACT|nr:carboxypeptidase regulatory-like domain-containing protein [Desulfonema limicola]QTA78218.1 carboxypeptidase domain-containing protein [Desulfonema limicola]
MKSCTIFQTLNFSKQTIINTIIVAVLLLSFLTQSSPVLASGSDSFGTAYEISGLSGQTSGTNIEASKEPGEPEHAGQPGIASLWWKWTAPENALFNFNTKGSDFDTLLGIYTGYSLDSLVQEAANDQDGSSDGTSSASFTAQAGTDYYIAVDGRYGASGNIVLNWRKAVSPANDNFADAFLVSGISGQESGSNLDATKETGEPEHASVQGGVSVWWTWTSEDTGYYSFDTKGTDFYTLLGIYTGSSPDTLVKTAAWYESVTFKAQAGTKYYIAIDGWYGAMGNIVLNWKKLSPENDNFASAALISGLSGRISGSNDQATKEPGEPNHAGEIGGTSVWWSWTAPENGYVSIDTLGTVFDTLLGIYTGTSLDTLVNTAQGYNSVSFFVNSGMVYYIALDGRNAAQGDIVLNWKTLRPPENDNFADAVLITGLSGTVDGSNIDAAKETGEPDHAGSPGGASIWWKWTAPENSFFSFDTNGSSFSSILLGVYTGSSLNNLIEKASSFTNLFAGLTFYAQAGVSYYIAADGYKGASGDISLNWKKITPPENDNFVNALELTGISGHAAGSNIDATKEPGEPAHAGDLGGASVWWTWTGPENAVFTFDTSASGFYTVLGIYTGEGPDNLTEVQGRENSHDPYGRSSYTFYVQQGVQYYIAVDGWYGASGSIILNWKKFNDNIDDADLLTGLSGRVSGSNVYATRELGEPDHAGTQGGKSIWWVWTAPETGFFYFDTIGSDFDTLLAVYIDSAGLNPVAANDDNGSETKTSSLTFYAFGGTRYYIAVDGWYNDSGNIVLNHKKASAPLNDNFASPNLLTGLAGRVEGTNILASKETGEPNHADEYGGKSVWWTWTSSQSTRVSFDLYETSFDALLGIYTGTDIDSLVKVIDQNPDDPGKITFDTQADTLYYIAVDGWNKSSGNIILNWETVFPLANDNFSQAALLTGISGWTAGANILCSKEPGEPAHAGDMGGYSVWWKWMAPENGSYVFDTTGTQFTSLIAVYTGSSIDNLTNIAGIISNGTKGAGFQAQAGVQYYIAVDGYAGMSGNIILNWYKVYDNFAEPGIITGLSGHIAGSNLFASKEAGEPDHAGQPGGASVWWTWTAPEQGYYIFDTFGSNFNSLLGIYTGSSIDNLTEAGSISGGKSLKFAAGEGDRYFIAVDSINSDYGRIILNWKKFNDNFADAVDLIDSSGQTGSGQTSSGQTTGTSIDASKEAGEPAHAGQAGGASVWWTWTLPEIYQDSSKIFKLRINTSASDFETILAVYTGLDLNSLTPAASGTYNLEFTAIYNEKYYIAIDGYNGNSGNINIDWEIIIMENPVNPNISGIVQDNANNPVAGARIKTSSTNIVKSQADGRYSMYSPGGTYKLIAQAVGYQTYSTQIIVPEEETIIQDIMMMPVNDIIKGDINQDSKIDLADAVLGLQIVTSITIIPEKDYKMADVNNDMRIGLEDVIYILNNTAR